MPSVQPPPPTPDALPHSVGVTGERPVTKPRSVLPERRTTPTATWAVVGLVVAAGFFGNLALRVSLATTAASLSAVFVVAALVATHRSVRPGTGLLLGLVLTLVPWLTLRSSVSLTALNVMTISVLLAVAAGLAIRGSLFDTRTRDFAGHIGSLVYEWLYGTAMVQRLAKRSTVDQRAIPMLRGAAVAIPVLIVFTTLLAAADEVFSQLLLIGNLPTVVGHVVLTVAVSVAVLALISRAAHDHPGTSTTFDIRFLGPTEVVMVLGSLIVLFAAFVATQVVVAAGGADHVLVTEGLTQAEHARRGFFQLLWVAGLAVVLVGTVRAVRVLDPDHHRDRFRPLSLLVLALTVVIAAVSMQRLMLYVGSFGMTPLRLWALAGVALVTLVIALLSTSIAGWRSDTSWFPGALVVVGALFVGGLNVLNPDAFVASYNLETREGDALDIVALSQLSDDATPTIAASFGDLDDQAVIDLVDRLCRAFDGARTSGPFGYNRSIAEANSILDALC